LLVALLLMLLLVVPALAQTPQKERRFVYGVNLFDGVEYATGFVPPAVDTIYVLADHLGVLDPKMTEVYFWPITNDYRADFTSLNELVDGRLEILQGGQVIQTIGLTDYVVQLDQGGSLGPGQVSLGADARTSWDRFQAEKAAYVQRLHDHADAQAAYQQKLDEIRNAGTGSGASTPLPDPPAEPAPFTLYSTEVGRGFPLPIAAGTYTLRVRDANGQTVPDSEKRLVAFGPRRLGVSYEVLSQERWTFPEQAGDPADVVYTVAGGVTYLRAFSSQELNAEAYARVKNPQDLAATPNRWEWVHVGPLAQPATLVVDGGGQQQRVQQEDFAVQQVPGAALGYQILPFASNTSDPRTSRTPDLTAYRVEAPPSRATLRLRMLDAGGQEIPGSARDVVVVSKVPGWPLALPVLLPLMIGLTVWLWRRQQIQSARSLSAEQRQRMA
jgi:hypothetical protein